MKRNALSHANGEAHLYEEVARGIAQAIESGSLQIGQKVPSVRHLSSQRGVSISTVLQAYRVLESEGFIEARPQSGYFVRRSQRTLPPEPEPDSWCVDEGAQEVGACLVGHVLRATSDTRLLNLSIAVPTPQLLPTRAVERALGVALKNHPGASAAYDMPPGCLALR